MHGFLGVEPERLEGGFGYTVPGQRLRSVAGGEGAHVVSFHEKPTPSLAARIVGGGALRYARPASETVADLLASKPP